MWHGFSWKFHVLSFHKSTAVCPNPHQIPWPFNVIYPGFICFACSNMTWIFCKFKMKFPWYLRRKWWDFHRIWSHFRNQPNCCQKDMRKSMSHVLQGYTVLICNFNCHFMLQIAGSLVQIHTEFHVICPGFICFPCWNMTWILDKF